jgi:hypothetical protein
MFHRSGHNIRDILTMRMRPCDWWNLRSKNVFSGAPESIEPNSPYALWLKWTRFLGPFDRLGV